MPQLLAFFLLTFAISWTAFIAIPHAPAAAQALLLFGTFGPPISTLILLRPSGIAQLNWSFSLRWSIFALAFFPILKLSVALLHRALTGAWPRFGAEGPQIIAVAILFSTPVQAGEELGWRGFALPRMAKHLGYGPAAVVLGVVWGLWHLPLFFVHGEYQGQSFPMFAAGTTALSVALAFLYTRTGASVLMTMLMHSAINQTVGIVPDTSPTPRPARPFRSRRRSPSILRFRSFGSARSISCSASDRPRRFRGVLGGAPSAPRRGTLRHHSSAGSD